MNSVSVPSHPAKDQRVNILLVDDRQENLVALDSVLADLGQNLVKAQSGQEALKHLLHEDYAVILLDVQMPGMDGFETATLIRSRERSQHTPIIFLTAISKGEDHISQGYSIGAADYVFKPFVPEVLKAKVTAFVELAKRTQQLQEEITHRQRAEEKVVRLNKDLERRVKERTAELEAVVSRLEQEIAERKQLELALQQRAEALAEADRRKDEFLAMLGHELRNPLAPILNALHVMRSKGVDDATLKRARDIVDRQVKHITRLIDDLLDVSRITQGKVELRKETVELSDIIDLAVEAAMPLVEEGRHRLSVEKPEKRIWICADGVRLQQVFTNLLNNASKYTEDGGEITLSVRLEAETVSVSVRDTGTGIPPEVLPRVFDLFAQGDCSLDRSQGGLGIGLTMVRKLVEMHGGSVQAHSEGVGKGSEFTLRLPFLSVQDPGAQDIPPERVETAESAPAASRSRILLVEDNLDAAESLGFILEISGYDVRHADSGPLGIDLAGAFRPQVILCDIGLPGMDGYEVAAKLRAMPGMKETTLIALTGYGQEEDRQKTLNAGFDHHLIKPVNPEHLQELLASITCPD
ncbi:MAG: response regulator [Armatimonadetes bacterium]|nr:response regulator [Armatimonadota bacterium]